MVGPMGWVLLRHQAGMNWDAQQLQTHELDKFRTDPKIQERYDCGRFGIQFLLIDLCISNFPP